MDAPDGIVSDSEEFDDVVVLGLTGELDLSTAPSLRQRLLAIGDEGKSIVLDLAGVSFADSTTLGVFVTAHKRLTEQGRRLAIANPVPGIRQILEITNLDGVIAVCGTRSDAIAQVREPSADAGG